MSTTYPASDKQLAFIRSLADERTLDDEIRDRLTLALQSMSKNTASATITWLLKQPKTAAAAAHDTAVSTWDAIPAGRYAVENDDEILRFYRVDKPAEGRWSGWTFLNVQASDEWHPIRDKTTKAAILAKIAADPHAAAVRYGREIGECSMCGRTLTDPESIRRGIGPICANKHGWLDRPLTAAEEDELAEYEEINEHAAEIGVELPVREREQKLKDRKTGSLTATAAALGIDLTIRNES
jgi:hypothetical protein